MEKFEIFKKNKKTQITRGLIVKILSLFFLSIFLFSICLKGETKISDWQGVFGFGGGFLLLLGIILKFYGMFNFEYLNGKLSGFLEFHEDKIVVGGNIYDLKKIKKIDIFNEDYKGRLKLKSRLDFDNAVSNGVGNIFFIELDNHEENVKIYFQQKEKFELKKAEKYLVHYCKEKKLSYLKLLEVINLSDFKEIQKFKEKYDLVS